MTMKKIVFALFAAALALGLFSCSKNDEPAVEPVPAEEADEAAYLAERIDLLTRSITLEDLKDLKLFLDWGETPGTIYLDITKGGQPFVKGEVGLSATEKGRCISLNLLAFEAVPIQGYVYALPLAKALLEARLYKGDEVLFVEALAAVNEAVDVQVLYTYDLQYLLVVDPESGIPAVGWYLVMDDFVISVDQLIEMLGLIM